MPKSNNYHTKHPIKWEFVEKPLIWAVNLPEEEPADEFASEFDEDDFTKRLNVSSVVTSSPGKFWFSRESNLHTSSVLSY